MRDNIAPTGVLVIVIVAFAGVTALVITFDESRETEADAMTAEDFIGHWYLAYEASTTLDGDFVVRTPTTDTRICEKDIEIFNYDGNVFTGLQSDLQLTGSYVDNTIKMYNDTDGVGNFLRGYVTGENVITVISGHKIIEGGAVVDVYTSLEIYTKNPDRSVPAIPGSMDIMGTWHVSEDVILLNSTYGKYGYGDLEVTSQKDNLFKYVCTFSTTDIRTGVGVFFKYGDSYLGILMTDVGRLMVTYFTEDTMRCIYLEAQDVGVYSSYVLFTRSGEHDEEDKSGLVDTSWKVRSSHSITGDGVIDNNVKLFTISFLEERSGVLRGQWTYGLEVHDLVGYVMRTSNGYLLELLWEEENKSPFFKIGALDHSGNMIITNFFTDTITDVQSTRTYLLEQVVQEEINILGHWYLSHILGYDSNGFYDRTTVNTPILGQLDFDIYNYENGHVYMWLMDSTVVGTYMDGLLSIEGYISPITFVTVAGWFENDNTFTLVLTQRTTYGGMIMTDVVYSTYTKVRGEVTNLETTYDLKGEWTAINPVSLSVDGEIHKMNGTKLTIDDQTSAIFAGVMEQTLGDETVTVPIKGALVMTVWGTVQGRLIDANGLTWNVQYSEKYDCMMINTSDVTHTSSHEERIDTVERRYIRGVDRGYEYLPDMVGKQWHTSVLSVMDEYGKIKTHDVDITFNVDYQYNNNFVATCVDNVDNTQYKIVSYLINTDGEPMYKLLMEAEQCDKGLCYGMSWEYRGNSYMVISYELDGVWYSGIMELTEVA